MVICTKHSVKRCCTNLIVLWGFLVSFSCENPSEAKEDVACPSDSRIQLSYSSKDSNEAKVFALWYSGELLPSDSLVCECLFSLNYLRDIWGDSIGVVNEVRFNAPWVNRELIVGFNSLTLSLVMNSQYTGWGVLDEFLQPDVDSGANLPGIPVQTCHPFRLKPAIHSGSKFTTY